MFGFCANNYGTFHLSKKGIVVKNWKLFLLLPWNPYENLTGLQ